MSDPHPSAASWPRPHWHPGNGRIVLDFFVFGKFPAELAIPAARYGSRGLPAGITLERYQNAVLRQWEGYPLHGELGAIIREETPEPYADARKAPEVLVVRGTLDDAATLDYLRDTLGVLAGLLDVGGSAILDPQILGLFPAAAWRERYLAQGGAPTRNHVLILCNADDGNAGRFWIRTRGMRKFGRPDLSVHNVPDADVDRAGALCEQLVELQALGAHFTPDQAIDVDGLPKGLVAQPGGDMADPRFNNTHVELRWPD